MAAETKSAPPTTEKEGKDEVPAPAVDNGQAKETPTPPASGAAPATAEKADEAKSEPAAPPKPNVHKPNFEKDVVYLYQFSRTPLLPSLSPYCLKTETWLRLTSVKYENVDHKMKFRSRKGQLPFVELNGEEIADSAIIIKDLSQKFGKDLDAGLTSEQRIISHAMISMIENHLSWVLFWFRTKNPDGLIRGYRVNLQSALGTRVPNSILNFFFKFSYGRKGSKKVKAQGIGVHSEAEIVEFGKKDLQALSDLLADKPFFFGDEPTTLDVVAFANLAQLHFIEKDVAHPLRDLLHESYSNLVGLVTRVKERAYPDWEDICSTLDLNAHLPKPPKECKEGTGPAEKQPAPEQTDNEKEKVEEKGKELEKEAEEKSEKEK